MEPVLLESIEPGDSQARSSFISTKAVLSFRGGDYATALYRMLAAQGRRSLGLGGRGRERGERLGFRSLID